MVDKDICSTLSPQQAAELSDSAFLEALATSCGGLSQEEASRRLELFGRNSIAKAKKAPLVKTFLANFTHLMALLLWSAGTLAFVANMPQLGIAVWMVNLVNGAFSFWQEYKAENATEALLKLLPSLAHVIREGKELRISSETLVPGDLVVLSEGDHISADARIISTSGLAVDESTLTGESLPVQKSSDNQAFQGWKNSNLLFAGTNVTSGQATVIVFATGMNTSFGKIAHRTQTIREDASPLQKEMSRVTCTVSLLALGIGAIFFLLSIAFGHVKPIEAFIFAIAMIVAFVPEGILPTISLSLALAVQRMAERKALVRRLSAVETLGCATVICTDKTGTITQNKMTVTEIWTASGNYLVDGAGYNPSGKIRKENQIADQRTGKDFVADQRSGQQTLTRLFTAAVRCNNSRLVPPQAPSQEWGLLGDPTEAALLVVAKKGGIAIEGSDSCAYRICEIPFDSHRQRMGSVYATGGTRVFYAKGAPGKILERCSLVDAGDCHLAIEEMKQQIINAYDSMASKGLRVLALAERVLPPETKSLSPEQLEHDLVFLGLVAMTDPPHEGVKEAIAMCYEAGIKIIMITGDHSVTADAIAKQVGIRVLGSQVLTGAEIDALDDASLAQALAQTVIVARAMPEQKLRIVTALQNLGHIVAVTGDGVNDAPALRKADIGIAMGIAGTDVAKESADVILMDDNFASIVSAIELGRAVYANIGKFATYVFNSNMAEAAPFIISLFSFGTVPLPLTLMQVLAVDLGTDMLPAVALGTEPAEQGMMKVPPRDRNKPLLNKSLLCRALLWYGLIEAIAGISCYFYLNWLNGWPVSQLAQPGTDEYRMSTTMTLLGIVMAQIGAVLCCRSQTGSVFSLSLKKNPMIPLAIASEFILILLILYLPPMQKIFHTAPLGLRHWCFAIAWIPAIIILDELRKLLSRLLSSKTTGKIS